MSSYNKVILLGNLTRDPELRHTPSGAPVADLGLAVNDKRKGPNGDMIDETVFVDVTLWNRLAEIACQYLRKGSKVLIDGRLKLDQWESEGQRRQKLKVIGAGMQMLGDPRNPTGQQESRPPPPAETGRHAERPSPQPDPEDDIPF
jgi:single-strand DNA-binding protein